MDQTVENLNPCITPGSLMATAGSIVSALAAVEHWLIENSDDLPEHMWGNLLLLQAANGAAQYINETLDYAGMRTLHDASALAGMRPIEMLEAIQRAD